MRWEASYSDADGIVRMEEGQPALIWKLQAVDRSKKVTTKPPPPNLPQVGGGTVNSYSQFPPFQGRVREGLAVTGGLVN